MDKKIYAKPVTAIFWAQIIVGVLFSLFGVVLFFVADSEVRIFVSLFILIFEVICISIIVSAVKTLGRIKDGKLEIAAISDPTGEEGWPDFSTKLRSLDVLKKDGVISDDEYQKKRKEIMEDKW